mmetsp:Transcript_85025/g.236682  ORF Transcript_85025/g.236682 Transcript_85025/m.236682 type:complete len:247 (+) Transcript_85025:108-848(+)
MPRTVASHRGDLGPLQLAQMDRSQGAQVHDRLRERCHGSEGSAEPALRHGCSELLLRSNMGLRAASAFGAEVGQRRSQHRPGSHATLEEEIGDRLVLREARVHAQATQRHFQDMPCDRADVADGKDGAVDIPKAVGGSLRPQPREGRHTRLLQETLDVLHNPLAEGFGVLHQARPLQDHVGLGYLLIAGELQASSEDRNTQQPRSAALTEPPPSKSQRALRVVVEDPLVLVRRVVRIHPGRLERGL